MHVRDRHRHRRRHDHDPTHDENVHPGNCPKPPSPSSCVTTHLSPAPREGDTFEQAVLLSVGLEDTQSFQRHFAQLKPYYAESAVRPPPLNPTN